MKIDKITGSVPNCIAFQIAYDSTRMYFNHIKYILIDLKLIKIDLLLNKTLKYLICAGSILGHVTTLVFFVYKQIIK